MVGREGKDRRASQGKGSDVGRDRGTWEARKKTRKKQCVQRMENNWEFDTGKTWCWRQRPDNL